MTPDKIRPETDPVAGDFQTFALEVEDDRKGLRVATVTALVLHAFLFAIHFPNLEREALAGRKAAFDVQQWGVPANFARALDITTQLAFAAGIEALRDAGIPLVRVYKTSTSGKLRADARESTSWNAPSVV